MAVPAAGRLSSSSIAQSLPSAVIVHHDFDVIRIIGGCGVVTSSFLARTLGFTSTVQARRSMPVTIALYRYLADRLRAMASRSTTDCRASRRASCERERTAPIARRYLMIRPKPSGDFRSLV